jgi:hypothetical protein
MKEIGTIRNVGWRSRVEQYLIEANPSGAELNSAGLSKILSDFGKKNNIKTIRILVSNQSAKAIPSAPFKAYVPDSFVCVDIWQLPKGKPGRWKKGEVEWKGAFWSYAQCKGKTPDKNFGLIDEHPVHPAAKYITRLFKNDIIEIQEGSKLSIMRVAGYSTTNNLIDLRPQYETEGAQKLLSINVLKNKFKKKLRVSEDGRRRC